MSAGSSEHSRLKLNIGGPSVVLLFTVLALSLFAALSVRAAYRELKLSEKTYEAVKAYYVADTKADEELQRICLECAGVGGEEATYDISIPVDDVSHIEMQVAVNGHGDITVPVRKFVADPVEGYSEAGFEIDIMFKDGITYDD